LNRPIIIHMKTFILLIFSTLFATAYAANNTAVVFRVRDGKPVSSELSIGSGSKRVMIAHLNCGFSRRAFKQMPAEVKAFLKENGIILAPGSHKYFNDDLKAVEKWNRDNPNFEHFIVRDPKKPLPFDFKFTPQFYFYKNGNMISHIKGWPKDMTGK